MSKMTCDTFLNADMLRVMGLRMLDAVAEAKPAPVGLLRRRLIVGPGFQGSLSFTRKENNYLKIKMNSFWLDKSPTSNNTNFNTNRLKLKVSLNQVS